MDPTTFHHKDGQAVPALTATEMRSVDLVVSLDVPSGVDATTGERPGVAVKPECVHTLALPKTGLAAIGPGLVLADIGLQSGVYGSLDIPVERPFASRLLSPPTLTMLSALV